MTAEVAVFNSYGIALAADSAVTTSLGDSEKIYNNADKLFQLSKVNPVAIMIYNNASINGSPWELLIKAFKSEKGNLDLPTVHSYAVEFFKFIVEKKSIITEYHTSKFIRGFFRQVISSFLYEFQQVELVNFIVTAQRNPTPSECHSLMLMKVKLLVSECDGFDFYNEFSEDDISFSIDNNYFLSKEVCLENIPHDENPTSPVPDELIIEFNKLFSIKLCKDTNNQSFTGIVFAGYGTEEYYPYLEDYKVYGVYNNKLMISKNVIDNKGHTSGIKPFAQDDEVNTFMEGCSKGLAYHMKNTILNNLQVLKGNIAHLISTTNNSITEGDVHNAFDAVSANYMNDCVTSIDSYIKENHVHKVLSILGVLAKPDLGYMAESLVNLTAFKRKISNDSDTVGGPIDVAILSKGDGFIWLKRKHYFNKDLNYTFHNRQSK